LTFVFLGQPLVRLMLSGAQRHEMTVRELTRQARSDKAVSTVLSAARRGVAICANLNGESTLLNSAHDLAVLTVMRAWLTDFL